MILDYLRRPVDIEPDFCFVLMPFNERGTRLLEQVIAPTVTALGMRCVRADHHLSSAPIMFEVFDDILRAQVIVADITQPNVNVYYELGMAHALKRHVVLLCEEGAAVPFDLRGVRHVSFRSEDSEDGSDLREPLRLVLSEILRDVAEPPGLRTTQALLKKSTRAWLATGDVVVSYERYVDIGLAFRELELSGDDLAFAGHAAAYFGRFMALICSVAGNRREFVRALVQDAAASPYVRVAWRAAIILDHCDPALSGEEIRSYAGPVENPHLFPDAVAARSVTATLESAMQDESTDEAHREKLMEVWKQTKKEFDLAGSRGA